jgi:hypothetical protein
MVHPTQWRVVIRGPWTDALAASLDAANIPKISGHRIPGLESHSLLVSAPRDIDAIALVKAAVDGHAVSVVEDDVRRFPREDDPSFWVGTPGEITDEQREALRLAGIDTDVGSVGEQVVGADRKTLRSIVRVPAVDGEGATERVAQVLGLDARELQVYSAGKSRNQHA